MRLTLAAGLFTIGVELPEAYLAEHARGLLTIVVPTMALGWFVVAGMSLCLFLTLRLSRMGLHAYPSFRLCPLPAPQFHLNARHCCLPDTDRPHHLCCNRWWVLSQLVGLQRHCCSCSSDFFSAHIGGKFATKHVPVNLRRIIAAESAANDGLAYPFLSLSIMLTTERPASVAFRDWFLIGCLCMCLDDVGLPPMAHISSQTRFFLGPPSEQ